MFVEFHRIAKQRRLGKGYQSHSGVPDPVKEDNSELRKVVSSCSPPPLRTSISNECCISMQAVAPSTLRVSQIAMLLPHVLGELVITTVSLARALATALKTPLNSAEVWRVVDSMNRRCVASKIRLAFECLRTATMKANEGKSDGCGLRWRI